MQQCQAESARDRGTKGAVFSPRLSHRAPRTRRGADPRLCQCRGNQTPHIWGTLGRWQTTPGSLALPVKAWREPERREFSPSLKPEGSTSSRRRKRGPLMCADSFLEWRRVVCPELLVVGRQGVRTLKTPVWVSLRAQRRPGSYSAGGQTSRPSRRDHDVGLWPALVAQERHASLSRASTFLPLIGV